MARIDNLTNFLTDIATAIRTKKETEAEIPAEQFDTEILAINTVNNQDKEVTENGTYTADEGYTGLGTVTVNVPQEGGSGDIKLFETEEEMQADTTAKEGDLAVVYRSEVQNATVDSKFQIATFPEIVVLSEAMTDYTELTYRATDSSIMFDGRGHLDKSGFTMDCWVESDDEYKNIRIEYTSEDGITYIRTDTLGNPVDFTTEIYHTDTDPWNDRIGKFIQCGGSTFDGLYQYGESLLDGVFCNSYTHNNELNGIPYLAPSIIRPSEVDDYDSRIVVVTDSHLDSSGLYKIVDKAKVLWYGGGYAKPAVYNGEQGIMVTLYDPSYVESSSTNVTLVLEEYDFTINNEPINKQIIHTWDDVSVFPSPIYLYQSRYSSSDSYNHRGYYFNYGNVDYFEDGEASNSSYGIYTISSDVSLPLSHTGYGYPDGITSSSGAKMYSKIYINKYNVAPTQLTLNNPNELLPGKIAYGKNGVVTGDESIYNNIDYTTIFKHYNGDLIKASQNVYSDKREIGMPSYLKNTEYNKFGVTTSRFISETSYGEELANANTSGEFIYSTTNYTILNWNDDVSVYDKSGNLIHHQTLTGLGTNPLNISVIDRGEKVYLINLYTKTRFDILPSGIESKTTPASMSSTWNKVWDVGNDDLLLFPEAGKLSKYSLSNNTVQVIRQESSGGGKGSGGMTFDDDYVYCGQVNNRIYVLNRTDLTYVGMTNNNYNVFSNHNNCYAYNTSTKFIYTIHGMDLVKIAECEHIDSNDIQYYDHEHSRVIYPNWSHTRAYDNNSSYQYQLGNISNIDIHMKCQNYDENLDKIIGYGVEDNGDFYEYETTFDKIIDGENTNNSIPLVILDNTHNVGNPYTIYKAIMLGLDTITPEQYNQALTTANEIKGGTV